jgi:hypothetical protein
MEDLPDHIMEYIFTMARERGDMDIISKLRKMNRRLKELCWSTFHWPWTPGRFAYNIVIHEVLQ